MSLMTVKRRRKMVIGFPTTTAFFGQPSGPLLFLMRALVQNNSPDTNPLARVNRSTSQAATNCKTNEFEAGLITRGSLAECSGEFDYKYYSGRRDGLFFSRPAEVGRYLRYELYDRLRTTWAMFDGGNPFLLFSFENLGVDAEMTWSNGRVCVDIKCMRYFVMAVLRRILDIFASWLQSAPYDTNQLEDIRVGRDVNDRFHASGKLTVKNANNAQLFYMLLSIMAQSECLQQFDNDIITING